MFETVKQLKQHKKQLEKNKKPFKKRKFKTPEEAIIAYCKQCCGGSRKLVEECDFIYCELWEFRCKKRKELFDELDDIEFDLE